MRLNKENKTIMLSKLKIATALIVALASTISVSSVAEASTKGDISGFFIAAENNSQANENLLKDIKKVGGDTVITFGYTLEKGTYSATVSDNFKNCKVGSTRCTDKIRSGITVRNYLNYKGNTKFTSKVRKCSRDIFTTDSTNPNRTYAFFAVPVNGTCSTSKIFDIVATSSYGIVKEDNVTQEVFKLGMKHYIGLPSPSKNDSQAWLPNTSYLSTVKDFTQRFVKSNSTKGLAGYYQHREMPMSSFSSWNGMLSLFKTQNEAVTSSAPSGVRNVLLSPYMDARKFMNQTPAEAKKAIAKMANTKAGLNKLIIAPQDGMGTGKGSAYTGVQWNGKVDPFARTVVGNVYNNQAYFANTKTYYAAMKQGLSGKSNVYLWANIESMAPVIESGANKNVCSTGHNRERGYTWKSRLQAQVNSTQPSTSKRISYHWHYLECDRNGRTPMKNILPSIK